MGGCDKGHVAAFHGRISQPMEIAVALPFLSLARLCGVTAGAFVATAMSVGYLYETAEAHIEAPTIKSARC